MKIQTINIHGKQYVPVAERLKLANGNLESVQTEIVVNTDSEITVKATIKIKDKGTFTGHATSNKQHSGIEGQSSVEVSETSALGRALGFAGYGVLETIATAEEVASKTMEFPSERIEREMKETGSKYTDEVCEMCKKPLTSKVFEWSKKKYNKALCFSCQKLELLEQAKATNSKEEDDPEWIKGNKAV